MWRSTAGRGVAWSCLALRGARAKRKGYKRLNRVHPRGLSVLCVHQPNRSLRVQICLICVERWRGERVARFTDCATITRRMTQTSTILCLFAGMKGHFWQAKERKAWLGPGSTSRGGGGGGEAGTKYAKRRVGDGMRHGWAAIHVSFFGKFFSLAASTAAATFASA